VETEAHAQRVALWTGRVATAMGMDERAAFWAQIGALLHDVGKIGVPDSILKKPGPLDESEWTIMRQHSQLGADLLAPVKRLAQARDVVLHHHESWDGSGYPHRLAGERIPLAARVFSPIDAYDAMTSDRPYRRGMSHQEAIARLVETRGMQFDPSVVDAIVACDRDDWLEVRLALAPEGSTIARD
jgi:putative nucleotidyltransferase with HDIG domain